MEAQLITEQELLEYQCADGSQVIIAASEDVLTAAGISTAFHEGAQVLEVLHEGEDEHGNLIFSAHNYPTQINHHETNETFVIEHHEANSIIVETEDPIRPSSSGGSSSNKCKDCGVKFATKKALNLHETVHVDESFYACEFCAASRIHWTEMWQHQCINIESAPIVCPQCHQTVPTKKQLQVHEEVHDLQRRFTGKRMEGYFKKKLQDTHDNLVDWGAKPFICGVCGKPFAKLYEVEYHEKLHTGERDSGNTCDNCGINYISRLDLTKHAALGCTGQISRITDAPFKKRNNQCQTSS